MIDDSPNHEREDQQITLFREIYFFGITHERILAQAEADPGFVGPEAYTVLGASI
jgi:hypothetical protein